MPARNSDAPQTQFWKKMDDAVPVVKQLVPDISNALRSLSGNSDYSTHIKNEFIRDYITPRTVDALLSALPQKLKNEIIRRLVATGNFLVGTEHIPEMVRGGQLAFQTAKTPGEKILVSVVVGTDIIIALLEKKREHDLREIRRFLEDGGVLV